VSTSLRILEVCELTHIWNEILAGDWAWQSAMWLSQPIPVFSSFGIKKGEHQSELNLLTIDLLLYLEVFKVPAVGGE
jgi:hypothetical protein